jgi:hypothetical protein
MVERLAKWIAKFMPDAAGIGLNLLKLSRKYEEWVPRRSERIEFLSRYTVRRTVQVDIDFESIGDINDIELWPRWRKYLILPVAVLRRSGSHTSFVISDEQGGVVPRINRSEERKFAFDATASIARTALSGLSIDDRTLAKIREIVYKSECDVATLREVSDQGQQLYANRNVLETLQYVNSFYFLAVPIGESTNLRRVIQYSYIGRAPQLPSRNLLDEILNDMGSVKMHAECPAAGDCASYHLEMVAPDGTTISDAELDFRPLARGAESHAACDNDRLDTQAHVWATIGQELETSNFSATLHLRSDATAKGAVLSGGFTVGVLFIGSVLVAVSPDFRYKSLNIESGVALLLLIPGVIGSVLAGTSPHTITANLLFPTRLLLWLGSVCSFVVAFAVAVAAGGRVNLLLWIGACILAIGCESMLWRQYFRLRDSERVRSVSSDTASAQPRSHSHDG